MIVNGTKNYPNHILVEFYSILPELAGQNYRNWLYSVYIGYTGIFQKRPNFFKEQKLLGILGDRP